MTLVLACVRLGFPQYNYYTQIMFWWNGTNYCINSKSVHVKSDDSFGIVYVIYSRNKKSCTFDDFKSA